ncbi:hypothetical protein N8T08_006822 [Aspergillus melleus]|uniref:Uncharacterized protein n=1 Tax=Aspergillus melleus TaxID=138277 RepID=A0ACC3AZN4_9EURO|nr:hypothetical protein N8T08_006822 [Aspergillus melleus]
MANTCDVIGDHDSSWHVFTISPTLPIQVPEQPSKNTKKKKSKGGGTPLIGIGASEEDDFSTWYQQVLLKSEMIDYYDISGCYILRPGSWEIWEILQVWFNKQLRKMKIRNCSFPLFVNEKVLSKEENHVEGFSAEVAWVTQSGKTKLDSKIAIRPTSETIIYPYLANWIRSHRDLPVKLNQYNSVVRWEFRNPQPFLRSREFYWQEGHTAHLTKAGADQEVLEILDIYTTIYQDFLAVPVIPGRKSENEAFAGADYTTSVEAFIPSTGRAIQGATSHALGQNFSKIFNISVENPQKDGSPNSSRVFVWQNSWAYSTRVIGVMVMVHGDDKGLVLPPRVAPTQVIIIPVGITASTSDDEKQSLYNNVFQLEKALLDAEIRVETDIATEYSPGWKFNHYELKGIPLRLEFGPKELKDGFLSTSRRDTLEKGRISLTDATSEVLALLETIQSDMYARALEKFRNNVKVITDWERFTPAINNKHVCLIPFCLRPDCEDQIKKMSERSSALEGEQQDARAPSMGAKSLCIPFKQVAELEGTNTPCLAKGCENMAAKWTLFGRSY